MNGMYFTAIAVLAFASVGCAPRIQSEPQSDPLRPLTQCKFTGDLQVVAVDRQLPAVRSREIMTAEGKQRVSVIDGYRVMLAYRGSEFFANMKIELSQPSEYSNDKKMIIHSMNYLSDSSSKEAGAPVPLEHNERHGLDVYGYDWPTIDFFIPNNPPTLGGGPIGIYVLFRDSARTVTMIYFLNQRPERRRFKSIAEYRLLRDQVVEEYTSCVAAR
jgi:hypothetical protein